MATQVVAQTGQASVVAVLEDETGKLARPTRQKGAELLWNLRGSGFGDFRLQPKHCWHHGGLRPSVANDGAI